MTRPDAIALARLGIGHDRPDRITSVTLIPGSFRHLLMLSGAPQHQPIIAAFIMTRNLWPPMGACSPKAAGSLVMLTRSALIGAPSAAAVVERPFSSWAR